MSTLRSLKTYIEDGPEKSGNDFFTDIRKAAFERYHHIQFPDRRHESWKYIDLNPILTKNYSATVETENFPVSRKTRAAFLEQAYGFYFQNGIYREDLSCPGDFKTAAFFQPLEAPQQTGYEAVLHQLLHSDIEMEENPFVLANLESLRSGGFWVIPKHVKLPGPLHWILDWSTRSENAMVHPHLVLVLEEGARAEIVIDETAPAEGNGLSNTVFKILMGADAELNIVHSRNFDVRSTRFFTERVYMEKNARFKTLSFQYGGGIVRNEVSVALKEPGAQCMMEGFSLLEDSTKFYQHTLVDHRAPQCESRQILKNILAGESLSEFNSVVHVRPNAQGTHTEQLNRNLLLTQNARALSRPQLRIYADDVKCNHGSANGQMPAEQLFYLRSRGLDLKTAKFLMMLGFAEEVLEQIHRPELKERLKVFVKSKLEGLLRESR